MGGISTIGGLGVVGAPAQVAAGGTTAGITPAATTAPGAAIDAATDAAASGQSFADTLGQAFSELNGQLTASDEAMASFAAGTSSADLGSLMLQMQEASLSLSLGVMVRDGLLDAYHQVMQLQV